MDVEDKPPGVQDLSPLSCTVRPTVSPASGLFSIESILKSGGFRYGGGQPGPEYPGLGGHQQRHGGQGVKKEDMEEDESQERRPLSLAPGAPGSSLLPDTAACHDDSGLSLVIII